MLLGGNRPVQSHSSSQPFSSLYLVVRTHTVSALLSQTAGCHVSPLPQGARLFESLLDVVVGQLFEDLTEDLVLERLGLQRSLKDLIGELVDRTHPFGRVVAHVLHHGCRRELRTTAVTLITAKRLNLIGCYNMTV